MRLAWALAPTLLAAAACGPSIDPAARADLDRRLGQIQTSEETYPPSETFNPMAFVVGQWTRHRVRDGQQSPQLITYKLVDQDEGGFWLETVTESYMGREIVKMHVFMLGGRDPAGMEIRAIQIRKGAGPRVNIDPGSLPTARQSYQYLLDLLAISFEGDVKDDAKVPGGHFIGCYKAQTGAPWGPWQRPTTVCAHPSVPLSGVVFAKTADGAGVMELVGFGLEGAASEM